MRICLFRDHANDPLSFLIKAETRGCYSHAAIEVDQSHHTIVEAYYPRVRKRTLDLSELAGIDFFRINGITPTQEAKVVAYCDAAVVAITPYSVADLLRFLAPVRAVLGEAKDGGLNVPKFCSMFAFDALGSAGIQLLRAHSFEVDPVHLAWSPLLEQEAA